MALELISPMILIAMGGPWVLLAGVVALLALGVGGFLLYVELSYTERVARMFSQAPVFKPLRGEPDPGGEEVRFPTSDGLELAGTYYRTSAGTRRGVLVFCHEYLGDRHSAYEYVGSLRRDGFDLFAFDCRNHGDSQGEPGYQIIQWVSDREVTDLRGALEYLRSREDADPAGVALFGVSRGGGTVLCVASQEPRVWAVVTDGAFPSRSTMLHYVRRWAGILVRPWLLRLMPDIALRYATWAARRRLSHDLKRRFPSIERAAGRIAPRPWLAIHGGRDAYIEPSILEELVSRAGSASTTTVWIVPKAKHNQCQATEPAEYRRRVTEFLQAAAPRRAGVETVAGRESEIEVVVTQNLRTNGNGSAGVAGAELPVPIAMPSSVSRVD